MVGSSAPSCGSKDFYLAPLSLAGLSVYALAACGSAPSLMSADCGCLVLLRCAAAADLGRDMGFFRGFADCGRGKAYGFMPCY